MAAIVPNVSRGPVLVVRTVHIIFVPDGVGGVDPASDALPTEAQLAQAANYVLIGSPAETDVIVFARRPWHYVDGKLRKHPEVHDDYPNTVLELDVDRRETVLWWSEREFSITNILDHDPGGSAPYPFDIPPQARPEPGLDHPPTTIHVARSVAPKGIAKGHEYKIHFSSGSLPIDPNMRCT